MLKLLLNSFHRIFYVNYSINFKIFSKELSLYNLIYELVRSTIFVDFTYYLIYILCIYTYLYIHIHNVT